MDFTIRIDYRTGEGRYQTAYRVLDHEEALQAPRRIGAWILEHLPEGAALVKISQGWIFPRSEDPIHS